MNGPKFDSGCPGAVHQDGRPSSIYCKGNDYPGTGYSYPWWKQCCKWNRVHGECQPKSNYCHFLLYFQIRNLVKPCLLDFDCKDLPVSMNGPKFDSGCPGAVHQDGRPSSHYCKGNSYIFGYSHPWWKQCCKWNRVYGECQPKSNYCHFLLFFKLENL